MPRHADIARRSEVFGRRCVLLPQEWTRLEVERSKGREGGDKTAECCSQYPERHEDPHPLPASAEESEHHRRHCDGHEEADSENGVTNAALRGRI